MRIHYLTVANGHRPGRATLVAREPFTRGRTAPRTSPSRSRITGKKLGRNAFRRNKSMRALSGKSLRVVFQLLVRPGALSLTVRELSAFSGASVGSVTGLEILYAFTCKP